MDIQLFEKFDINITKAIFNYLLLSDIMSNQSVVTNEAMDQIFTRMAQKSYQTDQLIEEYEKNGVRLGIKCTKMFCSIDKDNRKHNYDKLVEELERTWTDPILICFANIYDKNSEHSKNRTKVKIWCDYNKKYKNEDVNILFTGIAKKCNAPAVRTKFNGAHYYADIGTDIVVSNNMSIQIAVGFKHNNTIHIVDSSSYMYFDDDCITYGNFSIENNLADMHVSGDGWHQLLGLPIVTELDNKKELDNVTDVKLTPITVEI
jgi:hypothetical protein